jgi:hypothetical protein
MRSAIERVRNLRRRPEPAPPDPPTTTERLLARLGAPALLAAQAVEDFRSLRPWWPILIPLLIWEARRTYIRERCKVLAERRARDL